MKKTITKDLIVDFKSVESGWIYLTLTLGDKSYNTRFSDCFDPLPDLKSWLESICTGVEQCSFKFDCEGWEVKLNLERVSQHNDVLSIIEITEEPTIEVQKVYETIVSESIDRHQIVKVFYLGLLNFRNSDLFNKREWEVAYIWERLIDMIQDKVDYDTLLESLCEADREKLKMILFKADPSYTVEFPTAKSKEEEMGLFYDMSVGVETPQEQIIMKFPQEWNIPEDYDFWSGDKKRNFIKECIDEKASGYDGTKIEDFRSKIIESFLDNVL